MGTEDVIDDDRIASIEGDLADRPVAHLIHQVFRKRVTGQLELRDDAGDESYIFLREGCAVHIERPNDLDRLDRVLLEAGAISRAVLTRAQDLVATTNGRLGQVLLDLGAIDQAGLNDAIRSQLRRKLIRLLFVRHGTFQLFVEEHPYGQGDELAGIRVDPRSLLYQGIRTTYDDSRLIAELRPLENHAFRLVNLPPGFLEAMGMSAGDALLRTLGVQPLTLVDLSGFGGKLTDVRAAVLTLLYSDLLITHPLGDVPARPVVGGAPRITPLPSARKAGTPVSPPPGKAPAGPVPAATLRDAAAAAAKATIEDLYARMGTMNHFEILGLAQSASPDQVNTAYMKAVKSLHPDRLAGMGLSDVVSKAERVLARMTEASQALGDTKRRMEYVRSLRGEKSEAESARDILEAEAAFKEGAQALARNDLRRAMTLFTEAVKKSPKETEYRAYLAWTRYLETPSRKDVITRDTLRIIVEAMKERPNFVRGHFWIGKIHAASGSMDLAETSFRKCLELDPSFIDAEREMRILEMRRRKGDDASAGKRDDGRKQRPTLITRLLKRD